MFDILLTDLSKASHELLAAKLIAYGLEVPAVRLIFDYLIKRKQRTKKGCHYSLWKELLFGIPQRSVLGPLLFSIYLCDLFPLINNIDVVM